MDTTTRQARAPEVIAPGTGHHLHFLNHLATVKVRAADGGAMSVVEFAARRGFGPPLHRHHDEDELFVVLDGELSFSSGDLQLSTGSGGLALLPHGVPHTFQVVSDVARFVCVAASRTAASPRFDQMVAALGTPTDAAELPEPTYIDPAHVAEVCAAHGIEILGPPPAPFER